MSHAWQMDVEPQTNYVVIVQGGNSSNPINQLQILIQQAVESEINYIGEPVHYSETAASVNFTAPDQGIISVIVSSKIGENQENLGTFMVQLLEAPS